MMLEVKAKGPVQFAKENSCFIVDKKNTLAKITDAENDSLFKICEKNGQVLCVSCKTRPNDCGLMGNECKVNYDCPKAVDFFYTYFSTDDDEAICHLYDVKESIGYGPHVIKHLVEQWRDSIRFARSVCACYSVNIQRIFLGVVADKYDNQEVAKLLADYQKTERDLDNPLIPDMIKNNLRKNYRYVPGMLPILNLFVQKKFFFDGQNYDFKSFLCTDHEYRMNFVNGILQ